MSGKLGFAEFTELWVYICMCKKVFINFDEDKSGTFSSFEMQVRMDAKVAIGTKKKTLKIVCECTVACFGCKKLLSEDSLKSSVKVLYFSENVLEEFISRFGATRDRT